MSWIIPAGSILFLMSCGPGPSRARLSTWVNKLTLVQSLADKESDVHTFYTLEKMSILARFVPFIL